MNMPAFQFAVSFVVAIVLAFAVGATLLAFFGTPGERVSEILYQLMFGAIGICAGLVALIIFAAMSD